MGSMPSSTDPTPSDDVESSMACILHPTRGVATDSTTQLSFKSRARNQILRLQRELMGERERHERVVNTLREQNKEDVVSLSSRVEYFEAQWSRLQRRMSELWLEVERLKLPGRTHTPKSDASVQTLSHYTTNSSTQTRGTSSSNAATQTRESTHSNLGIKDAEELMQWRKSFNHVSGTPEQRAESSRSFLRRFSTEQNKNFKLVQSEDLLRKENETLARKIKDVEQDNAQQKSEIRRLQERNTNLSTKIDTEMSKREKLLRAVEEYQGTSKPQDETKRLTSTAGPSSSRHVSDGNNHTETKRLPSTTGPSPSRRVSDGTNHPNSPKSVQLAKRKREVSELDRQQDEPLPASQRRRIGCGDPGWASGERQGTIMSTWTAPQNRFGYPVFPESSTMWSMPPTGAPMGPSWETGSSIPAGPYPMSGTYPTYLPSYPMGPHRVSEGPWRDSGYAETLPARSLSPTSRSEYSFTNESKPRISLPVQKKWKHSMLRRRN